MRATKEVPDQVTIRVRQYCGTHIARAVGLGVTASCTMSEEQAAIACAAKLYGHGRFEWLPNIDSQTCIARRVK
jgi:hypothetical protein